MAHNIFHTGAEWFGDKIDDAKDFVEDKVMDYKVDKYIDSFTDNFEGPKKMTPELEAAGWKLGLDNIPYNPNAGVLPAYSYLEPPKSTSAQTQNTNNTGGTSTEAVSGGVLQAQDLRQRTPSGTMYEPDLSEYRASSLFEYAGPGGLEEYTYGQGLPMDGAGYDIWGSPAGSPNPYYEGQFGEGYVEPTGPADGAVSMPPVTMPDGVPQIPPSSTNNPSMPAFTGSGTQGDLDYFQTLAAMGINPSDAPSTTFPGLNDKLAAETLLNQNAKKITSSGMDANFLNSNQGADIGLSDYNNDGRISQADLAIFEAAKAERFGLEADTIGLPGYTNNGTISQADQNIFNAAQAERFGLEKDTVGLPGYTNDGSISQADQNIFNAAKMSRMPDSSPNVYDTQYTPVQYQIGGEEQMYDANYNMPATDDGSFNYGGSINNQPNFEVANNIIGGSLPNNITKNPNQETQPYRGMYIGPNTHNIDLPDAPLSYPLSFPADYGDGSNLVTVTHEPYTSDVPIVADDIDNKNIFEDIELPSGPPITVNLNPKKNNSVLAKQYGIDEAVVDGYEAVVDGYNYLTNLFNNADTNENTSIWKESQLGQINADLYGTSPGWENTRIWENPPEPDYGGMTMPPSLQEGGDKEGAEQYALMEKTARELAAINKVQYDSAVTSNMVNSGFPLDNSLSNSLIKKEIEKIEKRDLSNNVSQNLSKIAERRLATPVTYKSYGPPNMQRVGGRYGF